MTPLRFFAVIVIFGAVTVAWMVLGSVVFIRTDQLDDRLSQEVASQWGPKAVVQPAPYWSRTAGEEGLPEEHASPSAGEVTAKIRHEDRYKGLLWYSLFTVQFQGRYAFAQVPDSREGGFFRFHLPEGITKHDGLTVTVDGQPAAISQDQKRSGRLAVELDRRAEHTVTVAFTTYGQEVWAYLPGRADEKLANYGRENVLPTARKMGELKDFSLTVSTNFREIDYPGGTASPTTAAQPTADGVTAQWKHAALTTSQAMGMVTPAPTNAGPVAARMSFFAPVSLFFFFTVLFTVVVLKKIPLHPMHYLFISAAFFAFHILLAYLADHVVIHAAFWICAAVSTFLVVSYMRLVAGVKFAVTYVALAQLVYLVGFSYAFFWVGMTGLTIVIGAVATLFVLMQATGRIRWHDVFSRERPAAMASPPAGAAPPPLPQGAATDEKAGSDG